MVRDSGRDRLLRALSQLKALRTSIADPSVNEYSDLTESQVNQFHSVLSSISSAGIEVAEFKIPGTEIQPRLTSIDASDGARGYSDEKYVRKSVFLAKLNGIISYLNTRLTEHPGRTGFIT
ncbi:hypothetical protein ACFLW0_01060 [Chloroflexota bacterium]